MATFNEDCSWSTTEWAIEYPGGYQQVSDDRGDVEDGVQWVVDGQLVKRSVTYSEWVGADEEISPTWAEVQTAELLAERDALLAEVKELREVVRGGMHTSAKYYRKYGQALTERDRATRERDCARDLAARLEAELAISDRAVEAFVEVAS